MKTKAMRNPKYPPENLWSISRLFLFLAVVRYGCEYHITISRLCMVLVAFHASAAISIRNMCFSWLPDEIIRRPKSLNASSHYGYSTYPFLCMFCSLTPSTCSNISARIQIKQNNFRKIRMNYFLRFRSFRQKSPPPLHLPPQWQIIIINRAAW